MSSEPANASAIRPSRQLDGSLRRALFLSITLHEFAHGLAALSFGVKPTVYAGYETHPP